MPKLPRHVQIASKWACPKLPYKWACPQYLGMSKISIQMDMPIMSGHVQNYLSNGHAHNSLGMSKISIQMGMPTIFGHVQN